MSIKISVPSKKSDLTLAQTIALSFLAEGGLKSAAAFIAKGTWTTFTEQAQALQVEHSGNIAKDEYGKPGKLECSWIDWIGEIKKAVNDAAIADVAHGLGHDRFMTPTGKNDVRTAARVAQDKALKRVDQYSGRITGAWACGVLVPADVSAGKLEDMKRTAKAAAQAAVDPATRPQHEKTMQAGTGLQNAIALVSTQNSTLSPQDLARIESLANVVASIVDAFSAGKLTEEQMDEITTMAELAVEAVSEGEEQVSDELSVIGDDVPVDNEARSPMQAQG